MSKQKNAESGNNYSLTSSQLGVYLECLSEPESLKYNIVFAFYMPTDTDAAALKTSVNTVFKSHPSVYVNFKNNEAGVPTAYPIPISDIEIPEKTTNDINYEIKNFPRPFDFAGGPLFRFEILHTEKNTVLLFDIHHIVFDGTSVKTFAAELAECYKSGKCPTETHSMSEVSAYETELVNTPAYKAAEQYFKDTFGGVDCDLKPASDIMDEEKHIGGAKFEFFADKLDKTKILEFTAKIGVNENAFFTAAFAYTLAKFSGTPDAFFCAANHGRREKKFMDIFGMFVKTLPLYFKIDEEEKISDFVTAAYNEYYLVKKNSIIPFGTLAQNYGINTDISFVYQSELFAELPFGSGFMQIKNHCPTDIQLDMDIMLQKTGDGYYLIANYRKSAYSESFVKSFANAFLTVAQNMLCADTLGEIELVDGIALETLNKINRTEAPYESDKTVVDLFRAQAAKTPDNICVVFGSKTYTYREVDNISDNLARHLVSLNFGKEKKAGVLIPRNEYMVIASLGVLKSGGAYLPLDPTYPPERLNLMMTDSGAEILIYDKQFENVITPDFAGTKICTDIIPDIKNTDTPLPKISPKDLFVMLYTSGSTGTPKGVMFEHANAMVTTVWVKKYFNMDETSRVTAYASYGFDAHSFDIYPAITSGGELHIIGEDIRLDFLKLRDYFNEKGITHTVMTTQIGRTFALMGGLKTLKHLSVAGEKLTPLELYENFNFYNLYGPTEGSVITSAFLMDKKYKDVPIGYAVDNLKTYIVDKSGKLLPPYAVGELWISGPHVTRGYLNRPEKQAEAYGENTFEKIKGYERVYRTGDIVRIKEDGNLQFVGRRDAQVKVRGFRVELTEVEEVIRRFAGVKDATVAAFDENGGGKYLAAYIVSDNEISAEALAEFIRAQKPPYMVPAVTMQIDKIPLNQNGKVNKKALPVPVRKNTDNVKPENEAQQKIFDIISEVLGHTDFGINTDIYEAGLTSIGAVRLNVELSKAFDTPISISDIKENSTVKLLEKYFGSVNTAAAYEILPDYPITATQSGIFVESMASLDTTVYNIPALVKLSDKVDIDKLISAAEKTLDAHPYLKTTLFTNESGDIRAKRNDNQKVIIERIKCDKLPEDSELLCPFNLINSPLYKIAVYETDSGNYLYMDFHHIVCDGTSEAVIFSDITKAYMGDTLEKEAFSGFEAALEEQKNAGGEKYEKAREYWNNLLAPSDTASLPKKESESAFAKAGTVKLTLGDAKALKEYCAQSGVTLNAYFNAAFAFVLSRFANKESVTYTTVYNGRSDSRLSNAVTMLVKTLPVAVEFSDNETVNGLIAKMQNQLVSSISNDAYPFAEISRNNGVKADIIFVYQGEDFVFDTFCGEKAEVRELSSDTAKAPISVNVYLKNNRFCYTVEYRKDMYSVAMAKALAEALDAAVQSFMQSKLLSEVSLLSASAEEKYEILNNNSYKTENLFVPELIERAAAKFPEKTAVIANKESLTYKQLNAKANIMAHKLKKLGVGKENIIGVVLERKKEVMITEIAVMKAGGAFLPMIPTYPDDRIEYCLTNSGSPFVITTAAIKAEKAELFGSDKPYKTLTVEELLEGADSENLGESITPDQMAYCIYTSGSTGTPKGVMIEHHSFTNFVQTNALYLNYYKNDFTGAALGSSSISFDMSLYELYIPLCFGRTLVISTEEEFHNPALFAELIEQNNVQMMVCTPSFMNNLVSIDAVHPAIKKLKSIVVGAEAFPEALYNALREIVPELQIVNGYGPTEATICCSYKELHSGKCITIGRPTANMKMFVTDKFGNILPPYAVGELIICGEGVGRGYIRLPEKTAASYFTLRGFKAYHSGDMVRLNGNSEIEFGGRIDNQVKLRGFRIELDEIEKVSCSFKDVKQCKVLVRNNGTEDYLVGFYTAQSQIDPEELTAHLKSRLTYYMVPAVMMQLDSMPLTPNGKIDKNGFPEVQKSAAKKKGRKAPKKSLEQRLCEIFASVLNESEIYADDNFFELGGTSLSASKVTMLLMSENIEVKYGDIFDNPTPEQLARFIEKRDGIAAAAEESEAPIIKEPQREALKYNKVKYAAEVVRHSIGNVLLTGTVGFLGIHVLKELLEIEDGHIWCLVRKGTFESAEIRLKTMLVYYFSNGFEEELKNRITVLDADITDASLFDTLRDVPFDTVINCAACVKHFSDSDILTQINVHGVENLIDICKKRNTKLVHISTVSVPGIHTPETYEKQIKMHENELFVIDDMANKYGISKYQAELRILDAIESGLRAKIVRVGNLMGRHSDGEFQVNMETNMFMSGIRGFAVMGKYPISHMTDPMSFSPVDCTAKAVVLLAGTNDKFTAFNCNSRYGFDEMKIIDACNRNGITILPEQDEIYYKEFREKLGEDNINDKLGGLAAYDIKDAHAVDTDNLFTTNILYRIGFSWPLIDDGYLDRTIYSIMTLDYFDIEEN